MFIDGEQGRLPQGAAQRDVGGTSMPHDQDRVRIMTPVEQCPSAVKKWLARYAKGFSFALKTSIEQIRVSLPVRFDVWPDNDYERARIGFRHFEFPTHCLCLRGRRSRLAAPGVALTFGTPSLPARLNIKDTSCI
jgi:hypothetical protein